MPNTPHSYYNRIRPDWQEIESVRNATEFFLESKGFSCDVVEAISMVICELTENAIKYGIYPEASSLPTIEQSIVVSEHLIITQVSNPINIANHDCLERLNNCINWIQSYENGFEAYVDRIKMIDESSDSKISGLGLTRIAYEGDSDISCHVKECTVTVKATHRY